MTPDLALVFTVLMGVAILAYVVLDGYDLGVGMLLHLVHDVTEHSAIGVYGTPLVALILVVAVTAAGFIASGAAGPEPK